MPLIVVVVIVLIVGYRGVNQHSHWPSGGRALYVRFSLPVEDWISLASWLRAQTVACS